MTANTTTQLTLSRGERLRHFLGRQDRWRLASVLLVALVLIGGSVREALRERGQVATERPIIILATPPLPSPPSATPTVPSPPVEVPAYEVARSEPPRLSRAVIAYSAPVADAAIGAVEPGRIYTPTGRLGGEWLQAEVAGSGTVWLRLVDLTGLAGVPDIATPLPPVAPAVLVAVPMAAERAAQPTMAPLSPTTAALQVLTAPAPTPWDSEAAREAEREAERRAWESVDDVEP